MKNECIQNILYKSWFDLIHKVEEENIDLKQNVALNLIKLVDNSPTRKKLFPLNVVSLFGDLPLVKFIIEKDLIER